MKILHTADWHLGKRLYNKSRLDEQREILGEITDIARSRGADVTLVAGDVFDSFVPSAEAEELFYEAALALSEVTVPVFIAGNHDDPSRLSAPAVLARHRGVLLLADGARFSFSGDFGGTFTRADCADGMLTLTRRGETLNLGYLGYPTSAKLAALGGESYTAAVDGMIRGACSRFAPGGINVFMSHLFATGAEGERTDERELGGARILPKEVFDIENCAYVALGHIHKPMCVSKSRNVYYSGSIANYDFAHPTEKRVILADCDGNGVSTESIPLTRGKELYTFTVGSADEAIERLDEHPDGYVRIVYRSGEPLSGRAAAEMKRRECFTVLEVDRPEEEKSERVLRRGRSDEELFRLYYAHRTGKEPDGRLVDIFLSALGREGGAK